MPVSRFEKEKAVTFQELGEVQSAERGSTALTKLPDEFYEKAASYLKNLLAEMENCTTENGKEGGERYYRLSEDYRRSKDILERIYSTRERKIVLAALNSSRGISQKTEGMIHEEEELYFSLKVELEDIRERVLRYDRLHRRPVIIRPETGIDTTTDDFVEGPSEVVSPASEPSKASMMDRTLADLREMGEELKGMEKEGPKKDSSEDMLPKEMKADVLGTTIPPTVKTEKDADVVVIRAMVDIGPFVGPDNKTITLKKEDVTTLPIQVARILIDGGMVQIVEDA